MQKAEERLNLILEKSLSSGITASNFRNLDVIKKLNTKSIFHLKCRNANVVLLIGILSTLVYKEFDIFNDSQCFLEMPSDASKIFREPESCDICEAVTEVDKVQNMSPMDFYHNYSKSSKPVVISDGALAWPALKTFNFDFFKNLYNSVEANNGGIRKTCQFFPYKTEFESLEEVFNMKSRRAQLAPGEKSWYIGWSNCNDAAGKILQTYYEKPYFLANNSENIALSWIFMGGPGQGAHMHVDNVHYPSWQAQLSGRKRWRLAPPPECFYKCQEMEVTVEPGEIIVLDTNRWYHQTFILPGKISITIGSEFD